MFTKNLTLISPLLLLLSTLFNFNVVSATFLRRRSDVDLGAYNTNAKRFAAGLPPIAPVKRWVPTKPEVARRAQPSAVPVTRVIRVDSGINTLGYVSRDLSGGHYFLSSLANAGHFSTIIKPNGETVDINLKNDNSGLFLAGIVESGVNLGPNTPTFARVGESQATVKNDTPQPGKSPSLPGDAETAIWSYSANTDRLKVQWVDYNSGKPATDIMYDFATNTFYLTNDPDGVEENHPLAVVVRFFYVEI